MFKRKQKEVVEKIKENKILKAKFEVELINYDFNPDGELIKITCEEEIACYKDTFKEFTKRNVELYLLGKMCVPIVFDLENKLHYFRNYQVKSINALDFELLNKN